jgi:Fe-S cluster biosynthesis and repair protein YggX/thioredoxin-like negative regulator of GroEL
MAESVGVIERFQKMAEADPTNELGHFSLGRALLEAGRWPEAAASLQRVIELNPNMGRAYQLLGQALLKVDRREEAVERLTQGVKIASARGETMPKKEMIAMLTELGAAVPAEEAARAQAVGAGQVVCKRCGKVGAKLNGPPLRGQFGQEIFENICADCWRAAIGVGTKVINELRLPLDDPQSGKIWDQHIREFLNLSGGQ